MMYVTRWGEGCWDRGGGGRDILDKGQGRWTGRRALDRGEGAKFEEGKSTTHRLPFGRHRSGLLRSNICLDLVERVVEEEVQRAKRSRFLPKSRPRHTPHNHPPSSDSTHTPQTRTHSPYLPECSKRAISSNPRFRALR